MSELLNLNPQSSELQISNVFFKFYNKLKQTKSKEDIDELKFYLCKENPKISKYSVQTLLKLVEDDILELGNALNILVTSASTAKFSNWTLLVSGVTQIMLLDLRRQTQNKQPYICLFGFNHPFLILSSNEQDKMFFLASKISEILSSSDEKVKPHRISFLKSTLLAFFCDNRFSSLTVSLWDVLLETYDEQVEDFIYEVLQKSQFSTESSCFYLNVLTQKTLKHSIHRKNHNMTIDLLVYFTALTKNLLQHNFDPKNNFLLILKTLQATYHEISHWNLLLVLFAEILQICPPANVPELIKILKFMIVSNQGGNEMIYHMILDGIIQIIACPSFCKDQQPLVTLLNHIVNEDWNDKITFIKTSDFKSEILYYHPEIRNSYQVCLWNESKPTKFNFACLKSSGDELFWKRNNLVIRGLFLNKRLEFHEWKDVFDYLLELCNKQESLKALVIMPLLYKLANEHHPKTKMQILQKMTLLGAKDQIFNTIKVTSRGLIHSFAIDLFLRLWKVETRTYPFLIKILTEKSTIEEDENQLLIVKSAAIREICRTKPQQHGTDLVGLLSDILNNSFDDKSEIPAALALESICLLIKNHVINPVSTWKAIGFKLRYEKRNRVLKSLCKFFGIIPHLKSPTLKYDELYKEVLEKLWNFIIYSENQETIEYALEALKNFVCQEMNLDLTLDLIPEHFREGIPLPKAVDENGEQVMCVLDMEVPGECFFQILQNSHPVGVEPAKKFLIHLIREEIDGFRNNVYVVPENQPEPIILRLTKESVLKAVVDFLIKQATSKKVQKMENLTKHCLEILSSKFSKPIPPLNWCFLHEFISMSGPEIRAHSIKIAAKQSVISGTAKRLIENVLLNIDPDAENEIVGLFEVLYDLINGVSAEVLKTFLDFAFNQAFVQLLENRFGEDCLLYKIIEKTKSSLQDLRKLTKVENLFVVKSVFEAYLNSVDLNSKVFDAYAGMLMCLPPHHLQSITALHPDHSEERIQKSIIVRCEKIMSDKTVENPIVFMNEHISGLENLKSMQEVFLQNLEKVLRKNENLPKKRWVMDNIGFIQKKITQEAGYEELQFHINIFVVSVVVCSGFQNVLKATDQLASEENLRLQMFPESLNLLSEQPFWEDSMFKIFDFLHFICVDPKMPGNLTKTFKNSIFCCKNHSHFAKSKIWMKFLSL